MTATPITPKHLFCQPMIPVLKWKSLGAVKLYVERNPTDLFSRSSGGFKAYYWGIRALGIPNQVDAESACRFARFWVVVAEFISAGLMIGRIRFQEFRGLAHQFYNTA